MAAPKGNQFWKLRSKHGRDKLFDEAALLLEAAHEYFQWCDDNPWMTSESTTKSNSFGSEETLKEKPTARPYSIEGFRLYVGASESWFKEFRKATKDKDFLSVIGEIEDIIKNNQLEGATVGVFNANIISRRLGLEDKTRNVNVNQNSEPLTDEKIIELNKKLNSEY